MNLRSTGEVPLLYQEVFSEYPCFNKVQSEVFDDVFYTDKSLVISAPTGSGKTGIFELAIIRFLISLENVETKNFKIIYISPMKALCEERLVDWHRKFSKYGLNLISATGDSDVMEPRNLANHNFVITTPEKWDSLTRKWRDNLGFVKIIKLVMIDEVHLLNDESRGPTLEVIVCRMKTIQSSLVSEDTEEGVNRNQRIRFLAVSATVPNIEDVAEWFGGLPNVQHYKFFENVRPVPLNTIVLGYPFNSQTSTPFKFELSLNYKLPNLIMQYSEGKPTLIFCSTRKLVEMTAKHLIENSTITQKPPQKHCINVAVRELKDSKLRSSLLNGVGYHHGGLLPDARKIVENLFRGGNLPILVTTSTLAMGVNLPAHLVIIKSTKYYTNGGFQDYTETTLLQMIGRAGRPQFDTSATVLVLTTLKDKDKFQRMIGGSQPIESNLHRHLTEHVNAEVVLQTITDLEVALRWLSSTFLYIRARKNPRHYGLPLGLTPDQIDKKLLEMCQIEINKLVKAGMLTMDTNIIIKPTFVGILMAKYYLAFETVKLFSQMRGTEILQQILGLLSKCHEFSELYLRVDDKKCLNLLNKNKNKQTIRFPLNGRISTLEMKVNCIIQAVLGCLDINDQSIMCDAFKIMRNVERITKCLIEYLECKGDRYYSALLNTIILTKCLRAKLWENSPYVSKQLTGVGAVTSAQFVTAGKTTFDKILESGPRETEMIMNKKPPAGSKLLEEVKHLPKFELNLETLVNDRFCLKVELKNYKLLEEHSTLDINSVMYLLVGDSSNNILIYEKYNISYIIENPAMQRIVQLKDPAVEKIVANFISDSWVGFDCIIEFSLVSLKPADNKKTLKSVESKTINKIEKQYIQQFMEMYFQSKKKGKNQNGNKQCEKNDTETQRNTKLINSLHNNQKNRNDEINTNNFSQNKVTILNNVQMVNPKPLVASANLNNSIRGENYIKKPFKFVDKNTPKVLNEFKTITNKENEAPKLIETYPLNKNYDSEFTDSENKQVIVENGNKDFGSTISEVTYCMSNESNKIGDDQRTYYDFPEQFETQEKHHTTIVDFSSESSTPSESAENNRRDKKIPINRKAVDLRKYNYSTKRLSHSQAETKNKKLKTDCNTSKVSWRSPLLVSSPKTKYSPKFERPTPLVLTERKNSPPINKTKTVVKLPLSDKDWEEEANKAEVEFKNRLVLLREVVSDSLLDSLGLTTKQETLRKADLEPLKATEYYSELCNDSESIETEKKIIELDIQNTFKMVEYATSRALAAKTCQSVQQSQDSRKPTPRTYCSNCQCSKCLSNREDLDYTPVQETVGAFNQQTSNKCEKGCCANNSVANFPNFYENENAIENFSSPFMGYPSPLTSFQTEFQRFVRRPSTPNHNYNQTRENDFPDYTQSSQQRQPLSEINNYYALENFAARETIQPDFGFSQQSNRNDYYSQQSIFGNYNQETDNFSPAGFSNEQNPGGIFAENNYLTQQSTFVNLDQENENFSRAGFSEEQNHFTQQSTFVNYEDIDREYDQNFLRHDNQTPSGFNNGRNIFDEIFNESQLHFPSPEQRPMSIDFGESSYTRKPLQNYAKNGYDDGYLPPEILQSEKPYPQTCDPYIMKKFLESVEFWVNRRDKRSSFDD